jgi:YidC/Oxa1 family membrane protein insertase
MYGDHVSLFTLLMTVTTMLSMRWNNQATAGEQRRCPGMKTMMYIMPVMFMFILNNFSAGLTYYYFLANLITLGQNLVFKQVHRRGEDPEERSMRKKNQPSEERSRFAQRLEALQRQQQQLQPAGKKPLPKEETQISLVHSTDPLNWVAILGA